MNLITEEPTWYLILCILIGAGYAGGLYFRSSLLDSVHIGVKGLMAAARFVLVSLLCFLLMKPLLTTLFREVEKPLVILAQDNSESVMIGRDSAFYKAEYPKQVQDLAIALQADYDVVTYSFGDLVEEGLSFDFSKKQTDLAALLEELYDRYSNRNIGAVVVASDGIVNKGKNPLYTERLLKAPVYAIGLGDTAIKRDLLINQVAHNRLAYLGNRFPLEITVDASRFRGKESVLTVEQGGEVLFEEMVKVDRDRFTAKFPVLLDAEKIGIQKYTVRLKELEREVSYVNNQQSIYIDVLDGRQKILILADVPHPDVAALRESIEKNENYEVEARLVDDFDGTLAEYNLVVLFQLPSRTNQAQELLKQLKQQQMPVLYVLGQKTYLNRFNDEFAGLNIRTNIGRSNESQAVVREEFDLFNLSEETKVALLRFPPLKAPFGAYRSSTAAQTLLVQKIGLVETEQPLMLFQSGNERKTGIIAGEGLWRWKLHDYLEHGDHQIFDELIGKTVQYLSVKDDKSYFRVFSKNNFLENESITFDAELYNESYELVNDALVELIITDQEGKEFPFRFSPTSKAYRLDAGLLPPGEYNYVARTTYSKKELTETGVLTVSPVMVEAVNTTADHQLLYNLASKNGGALLYPSELASLPEQLKARGDIKPVSYSQRQLRDLINLKWVFFVLLGLLSLEWFLRKRNGAY